MILAPLLNLPLSYRTTLNLSLPNGGTVALFWGVSDFLTVDEGANIHIYISYTVDSVQLLCDDAGLRSGRTGFGSCRAGP